MLLIVTKSSADCIFPKMDALHCIILSHMLLLQWDWHSHPESQDLYSFHWTWVGSRLPLTKDFWGYQAKEIVSTWFSLSGHSPLELSHDAANKPKLIHVERLRGGSHVERNCGPKWHLVATASWVHDLQMIPPPSFTSSIWWPRPCGAGQAIPAVSCPNALPTEFENIINYNYVCFIPLTCSIICYAAIVTGTESFQYFLSHFLSPLDYSQSDFSKQPRDYIITSRVVEGLFLPVHISTKEDFASL